MPEAARRTRRQGGTQRLPALEEALGWLDDGIDEIGGSGVARVEGVFVDAEDGTPSWVVAKLGRFGKSVAVPVSDCAGVAGRVWVPHGREAIRGAPSIDAGRPLAREHELAICRHYGIHEGMGRAAVVGARAEGTITSLPAESPSGG